MRDDVEDAPPKLKPEGETNAKVHKNGKVERVKEEEAEVAPPKPRTVVVRKQEGQTRICESWKRIDKEAPRTCGGSRIPCVTICGSVSPKRRCPSYSPCAVEHRPNRDSINSCAATRTSTQVCASHLTLRFRLVDSTAVVNVVKAAIHKHERQTKAVTPRTLTCLTSLSI